MLRQRRCGCSSWKQDGLMWGEGGGALVLGVPVANGGPGARPHAGHPRPRPLPASPPLSQGWGRPLPGPRGLPGFRAEGPRSRKRRQEGKARFIGSLGGALSPWDAAGEGAGAVAGSAQAAGGRRQVPGNPAGRAGSEATRTSSLPSPSVHLALRPSILPPSSSLPGPVSAAAPG